ncbi:hypothetical protein GQ53DRAFT_822673 [Thozetella sp. PMI_491]|nr:hypothetical protein GQ53DRAFT_822673 [Thozetella sp. PMI_491]
MSQILDNRIRQWRVLKGVIPLFSLDLGNSWKLLQSQAAADPATVKTSDAQFKAHITNFRIHIRSLSKLLPQGILSRSNYNLCMDDLSSLVDFLEDQIVLGKEELGSGPLPNAGPVVLDVPENVEDWLKKSEKGYSHTTWQLPRAMKGYENLRALAKLIKQHRSKEGDDLVQICQDSIEWGQTLQTFKHVADLTKYLKKTFEGINPSGPGDAESGESMCNWNDYKPLEDSYRLYRLLGGRTCQPGHQVMLQLDGFRLNRRDTAGSRRFFVFLSCSKTPGEWREGKYKAIEMEAEDYIQVTDLCRHTKEYECQTHKVFFTGPRLWYPSNGPGTRPFFPRAFPTISLDELLRRGVLGDLLQSGRFTTGDKAVLTFSLALCLLHLFRGSWIQDTWSADIIHFLYEPQYDPYTSIEKGGKIFNIHYPYISSSLQKPSAADNEFLTITKCRPLLLSFATVLVQIETGQLLPLPSDQETARRILFEAERFKTKNKNAYLAIKGCLDIVETPSDSTEFLDKDDGSSDYDSDSDNLELSLEVIRNDIFQKVLLPLEASCRHFSGVMRQPKHGPINIPGPLSKGAALAANVSVHPFTSVAITQPPTNEMLFFEDDVTPISDR